MFSDVRVGSSGSAMPQTHVGPVAGDAALAPAANSPKVQDIPKVDIKVDAERTRQNLQEAIHKLNELVRDGGRGLNFSVDEQLGRPVVFVKNSDTGEVIRQIPTEEVVRVAHSIENIKGLLHKSSV